MLFASGRQGWAIKELTDPHENLNPLFDLILEHVPAPNLDVTAPLRHGPPQSSKPTPSSAAS